MNIEDALKLAGIIPASLIPKLNETFSELSWRQEDYRIIVGPHEPSKQDPVTLKGGSQVDMSWDVAKGKDETVTRVVRIVGDGKVRLVDNPSAQYQALYDKSVAELSKNDLAPANSIRHRALIQQAMLKQAGAEQREALRGLQSNSMQGFGGVFHYASYVPDIGFVDDGA